jgi:hypothetical protein
MRAIFSVGALGNLILSLSKDEVFGPRTTTRENLAPCPSTPRPVTNSHGFDRFFRAAMAQLPLIRSAALLSFERGARLAHPCARHARFKFQG